MAVDSYDEISEQYKSDSLYFITDGEFVKIGRSQNPEKRLFVIQTGNPSYVEILAAFPNMGWQERLWHRAFTKYRKRGEWFYHRYQIIMAIEAAQSGEEWISTLCVGPEDHDAHMPDTDADFFWRHEVADYEEYLIEKYFYGANQ